jgi:hypothetical protein
MSVFFFHLWKKVSQEEFTFQCHFSQLFGGGKRVFFFRHCFLEFVLLKSLISEYRAIMKKSGGNDYNILIYQYNFVRNRLSGYFERGGRILALVKLLYIYS